MEVGGEMGRDGEIEADGERERGKNSKMAVCTLVKLEAYTETGSHMRRVATATKGGSEVLWDGGAVGHPQRMSSATAFFFSP